MHISIDVVDSVITGDEHIISSVNEDEAVIKIIRDALEDARDGGYTSPRDIWVNIAAKLGITI